MTFTEIYGQQKSHADWGQMCLPEELEYSSTGPDRDCHPLGTGLTVAHSSQHCGNKVRDCHGKKVRGVKCQEEICSDVFQHCDKRLDRRQFHLFGVIDLISLMQNANMGEQALLGRQHLRRQRPVRKDKVDFGEEVSDFAHRSNALRHLRTKPENTVITPSTRKSHLQPAMP
jgi:hypothetical protein